MFGQTHSKEGRNPFFGVFFFVVWKTENIFENVETCY